MKKVLVDYSMTRDFSGWKLKEYALLAILIIVQLLAFTIHPTSYIALFGAICGAVCVVLVAKGKVTNYLFGAISSVIILVMALQARVYAEMPLQVFYIIVDIISVIVWFRASTDHTGSVKKANKFTSFKLLIPVFLWIFLADAAYLIISMLGDAQPLLDACTAGMGATAMILLLFRYRENFIFWFITNLLSIVLWFKAGQYTPAGFVFFILYCCYFANSIMGTFLWVGYSHNEDK